MTDFKITIISNEEGIEVQVKGRGRFHDILGAIEVAKMNLIHDRNIENMAREIAQGIKQELFEDDDEDDSFDGGIH